MHFAKQQLPLVISALRICAAHVFGLTGKGNEMKVLLAALIFSQSEELSVKATAEHLNSSELEVNSQQQQKQLDKKKQTTGLSVACCGHEYPTACCQCCRYVELFRKN